MNYKYAKNNLFAMLAATQSWLQINKALPPVSTRPTTGSLTSNLILNSPKTV